MRNFIFLSALFIASLFFSALFFPNVIAQKPNAGANIQIETPAETPAERFDKILEESLKKFDEAISRIQNDTNQRKTDFNNSDLNKKYNFRPNTILTGERPVYKINLSADKTNVSGNFIIKLTLSEAIDGAELYFKKEGSNDKIFSGVFTLNNNEALLSLDSTQVPNGRYEALLKITKNQVNFEDSLGDLVIRNLPPKEEISQKILKTVEQKIDQLSEITEPITKTTQGLIETKIDELSKKIIEQKPNEKVEQLISKQQEEKKQLIQEAKTALNELGEIVKQNNQNPILNQQYLSSRLEKLTQKAPEQKEEITNKIEQTIKEKQDLIKEKLTQKAPEQKEEITNKIEQTIKEKQDLIKEKLTNLLEPTKAEPPLLPPVKNDVDQIIKTVADFDGDGLSNIDELRFGTDIFNPDSDNDGYLDGIEVSRGYNPLSERVEQKMQFESPKVAGAINEEKLKVEKVEIVSAVKPQEPPKLKLEGKALPNSFVTIFIYSDPIIVTVKTDPEGNWSYVLDKNLDDGHHEVYVVITENTGKIIEKSKPLAFVKTAQAISIVDTPIPPAVTKETSPLSSADSIVSDFDQNPVLKDNFFTPFMVFLMIVISVFISLIILAIIAKTHESKH